MVDVHRENYLPKEIRKWRNIVDISSEDTYSYIDLRTYMSLFGQCTYFGRHLEEF
jgi:hypothetical protein